MTGIVLLDVAIGVFFALLIFSLAATTIREAFAALLNLRGKMLREGLYRLVSEGRGPSVMAEGPLKALHGPGNWLTRTQIGDTGQMGRLPSSIPSLSFAKALLQTLATEYAALKTADTPVDRAVRTMKTQIGNIDLDTKLRAEIAGYLGRAQAAAEGELTAVDDALDRAEARLNALGLPAEVQSRVAAVLKAVRESGETVRESVPSVLQAVQDGISALDLGETLKTHLTGVVDHVQESLDAAREELVATVDRLEAEIAHRFDTAMDRVIGWYARWTKLWLFLIGLVLAMVTNFNIIGYAGDLVRDDDLRSKIAVRAELIAETARLQPDQRTPADFEEAVGNLKSAVVGQLETLNAELGDQGVPLGWPCPKAEDGGEDGGEEGGICVEGNVTLAGVLSWLIVAFACTMGGQFWYDALKKLLGVRAAIAPPPSAAGAPAAAPSANPAAGGGRARGA